MSGSCEHRYWQAVSVEFTTKTVVLRCEDCGHEAPFPCTFDVNEAGLVVAVVAVRGFVPHVETKITLAKPMAIP